MSAFREMIKRARQDAMQGDWTPKPGTHTAVVVEGEAFESKSGEPWAKTRLQLATPGDPDQGRHWDHMMGFRTPGLMDRDAMRFVLRLEGLTLNVLGDANTPIAGFIKSGALDLSKPANLVNIMPKKPAVLVDAKDDRVTIDLMKIPKIAENNGVKIVAGPYVNREHMTVAIVEADTADAVDRFLVETRLHQWNTMRVLPSHTMEEGMKDVQEGTSLF